jgi:hypothetical protein
MDNHASRMSWALARNWALSTLAETVASAATRRPRPQMKSHALRDTTKPGNEVVRLRLAGEYEDHS